MIAVAEQTDQRANEQRFQRLASQWKSETVLHSKVSKRILHPAYQRIIGMGQSAIAFILRDLADNGPDDWFWALTAITDENPVSQEMAGNMRAMTEEWLKWGRQAGYLNGSQSTSNCSSQT